MAAFNGISPIWDITLPPSLPDISDDQFLAILNQQFHSTNKDLSQPAKTAPPRPAVDTVNRTANPQVLSRLPPTNNTTPPLSDDSSSSPGSSNDHEPTSARPGAKRTRSNSKNDADTSSASLKRKPSIDSQDDDDDQPSHKTQHTEQKGAKKSGLAVASRKSTNGSTPTTPAVTKDESRLLKRKEQNRAAQRAFRERKEKHVKDLEDKLSQLEAKTVSQQAENENLRDLLQRLQNENLMLKQTAFTFNVPGPSSANPNIHMVNGSATNRTSPDSTPELLSMFSSPSAATTSSPSTHSPASVFDAPSNVASTSTGYTASPPQSNMYSAPQQQLETPWTTIASAPMFMSYRDPAYDFDANFSTSNMNSWSMLQPTSTAQQPQGPLVPFPMNDTGDVSMDLSALSASSMNVSGLQDLFGGDFQDLMPYSSQFDANGLSGSGGHMDLGSPVTHQLQQQHHATPPTSTATSAPASSTGSGEITACPNSQEELAKFIESAGPSVFPAQAPHIKTPEMLAKERHCISKAWDTVRHHPRIGECDIDELCSELAAKAKCDGSGQPNLEPSRMYQIVEAVASKKASRS